MAATLWRAALAIALAFAVTAAFLSARFGGLSWGPAVLVAIGAFVFFQYALVALSIVVARILGGPEPSTGGVFAELAAALQEPLHFTLAQLAMCIEPRWRVPEVEREAKVERSASSGDSGGRSGTPVLLIHGLACNRGVWRWLLPRLGASGFTSVFLLNLQPLRADLATLAGALEHEVRRIQSRCAGRPVILIGHSMGGLLARSLLQSLGTGVVRHVITVGTPHHGSGIARVLRWPCAREICVGSRWLSRLNASEGDQALVPVTSIYSLNDNLVRPVRSSRLRGARMRELRGLGHFGLIVSRRGLAEIMSALEAVA